MFFSTAEGAMPTVILYGAVDYAIYEKMRRVLRQLRTDKHMRVNQRTFVGGLITKHIDAELLELGVQSLPDSALQPTPLNRSPEDAAGRE
jgi:hypothetical protein